MREAYSGVLQCSRKCEDSPSGAPFTLTLSNGTILHGACGYGSQTQAETSAVTWMLSDVGAAAPPKTFDVAMNSTNASVYTSWKCSDYKASTCHFRTGP